MELSQIQEWGGMLVERRRCLTVQEAGLTGND